MDVFAKAKNIHVGPRKTRRVAKLIVGHSVVRALTQLKFLPHHSARVLEDVLKSAIANAKHNFKLSQDALYVRSALIDAATPLKRFRPRQRGRAFPILKRISHVTVIVSDTKEKK